MFVSGTRRHNFIRFAGIKITGHLQVVPGVNDGAINRVKPLGGEGVSISQALSFA